MTQVADAHGGSKLVELGIAAGILHVLLVYDAEVAPLGEPVAKRLIGMADGATLDGVEHLGGVEREHGGIAEPSCRHPVLPHAEGVGRIVDDLKAMIVGDGLDRIDVAQVSVDVHRQNGAGALGDKRLDLSRIKRVVIGLDVSEDRLEPLSHNGVGGGRKGEGRRDDLIATVLAQLHRLKHALQRGMAVDEQRHVVGSQVFLQALLQLLVLHTPVGQPVTFPQGRNLCAILLERRHRRPRNEDPLILYHTKRLLLPLERAGSAPFPIPLSTGLLDNPQSYFCL